MHSFRYLKLCSRIARSEFIRICITSVPVAAHLSDRASDPGRFGPDHLGVVRDDPLVALAVCAHEPPIREFDLAVPRMRTSVRRWCDVDRENTVSKKTSLLLKFYEVSMI